MRAILYNREWPACTPDYDYEFQCVFMDPPDNIGLKYDGDTDKDNLLNYQYEEQLKSWMLAGLRHLRRDGTMWVSFNAKHTFMMGRICDHFNILITPMVQTYTFYQHNHHDFGTAHRPLYRFQYPGAKVYADQIRCESERQKAGDKRADPRGKVPGTVFDFPRVVGNSKQRRKWHPTQLHEDLVERCIKSCTREGAWVLDPFMGTGTTLRVCKRINRNVVGVEKSKAYCDQIAKENEFMEVIQ